MCVSGANITDFASPPIKLHCAGYTYMYMIGMRRVMLSAFSLVSKHAYKPTIYRQSTKPSNVASATGLYVLLAAVSG